MARSFASASSQRLRRDAAWVTTTPMTFSAFVNRASAVTASVVGLWTTASPSLNGWTLDVNDSSSVARAITYVSNLNSLATQGTIPASGTPVHVSAVFASATSRIASVDGVQGTPQTTARTPSGTVARSTIGVIYNDGGNVYQLHMNGDIWEVGVWNVALDAGEIKALAQGYPPSTIRPASLVAYYPLGGRIGGNNDLDRWKSKLDMTPDNSPTFATHGRMIYPGDG